MRQKEVHAAQGELKLDNSRAAGPRPSVTNPNRLPPSYPWAIWHTNVLQLKDNSTGLETGDNCRRRAHTEGLKNIKSGWAENVKSATRGREWKTERAHIQNR